MLMLMLMLMIKAKLSTTVYDVAYNICMYLCSRQHAQ